MFWCWTGGSQVFIYSLLCRHVITELVFTTPLLAISTDIFLFILVSGLGTCCSVCGGNWSWYQQIWNVLHLSITSVCFETSDCVEEYCSICHVSWKGSKDSVVGSKVQHVCGFFELWLKHVLTVDTIHFWSCDGNCPTNFSKYFPLNWGKSPQTFFPFFGRRLCSPGGAQSRMVEALASQTKFHSKRMFCVRKL